MVLISTFRQNVHQLAQVLKCLFYPNATMKKGPLFLASCLVFSISILAIAKLERESRIISTANECRVTNTAGNKTISTNKGDGHQTKHDGTYEFSR